MMTSIERDRFLPPSLRADRRRGFALVLVMGLLVLLMTLLVAAQGSVLVTALQVRRSAERLDDAESEAALLAVSVGRGSMTSITSPGGRVATVALEALGPADSIYQRLPGVVHREGDARAVVSWSDTGAETSFLVNRSGRRRSAIRIPASNEEPIP